MNINGPSAGNPRVRGMVRGFFLGGTPMGIVRKTCSSHSLSSNVFHWNFGFFMHEETKFVYEPVENIENNDDGALTSMTHRESTLRSVTVMIKVDKNRKR